MFEIGTVCTPTFTCAGVAASERLNDNGASSTAPRSHAAPDGRAMLRWSITMAGSHGVASIAGLPSRSICVSVGPPLSANGSSAGSSWITVPTGVQPGVLSTRLTPWNVGVP